MVWGTILASIAISVAIYLPGSLILCAFQLDVSLWIFHQQLLALLYDDPRDQPADAGSNCDWIYECVRCRPGAFSDPLTGMILDLGWDGKIVDGARIFSVTLTRSPS